MAKRPRKSAAQSAMKRRTKTTSSPSTPKQTASVSLKGTKKGQTKAKGSPSGKRIAVTNLGGGKASGKTINIGFSAPKGKTGYSTKKRKVVTTKTKKR